MKTAIVFDMDGTLFQTNLLLEQALDATFEKMRVQNLWQGETPIDIYRAIMGVSLPVVWATLCPNHSQQLRKQSNEWFQEQLIVMIRERKGALYEGVKETLQQLAQHYPLYIASNGQTDYLQAIVEIYQLQRFIKNVYSIDLIESGNKSELVKHVLEENQFEHGFVVGDRLSDFQAAKDNGLQSIGVHFDFAQPQELAVADEVIHSFSQLLQLIPIKKS